MAILKEEDRLLHRIIFSVAIVVLLAVPVTAVRLFAALVILCYLPAAPFAARAGTSFLASIALTVMISPLMVVLPVMVVMLLGLPVQTAVWAIVGIVMAQFLVYGTQRGLVAVPDDRRLLIALAVIVAVAAFLTLWLPLTNTWWRFRADSWFHAAVFNRIANHGLPVDDPYFSALRLQYMYYYHVLLLTVSTLTGLGPFAAMIFTNFVALGGCVLGANFLIGVFTRRTAARALGVALCVFGMNGMFYLFFPLRLARALLGDTTSSDIIQQFFSLSPLGRDTAARFLSIEGNQFLFLDKFMLGTALSLTLGLVCVVLALIVMMRSGRWNWILSYFYVTALTGVMFLHLIIGVTVVAATAGSMVVLALTGPRGRAEQGDLQVWRQAVLTAAAVVVALPYMMSVAPGESAGRAVGLAVQTHQIIGMVACILPALIPAVWYIARGERPRAADGGLSRSGVLVVWAACVFALSLIVDLPTTNETKFAFPLYLALTALAAGAFGRWLDDAKRRGTAAVIVYVVLCTLPVNSVYFASAFSDRTRFVVSPTERSVYHWIQRATSTEAVFLEADDVVRIPVLAARDQYWGTEMYARNWNYPEDEMNARRALRDAVFGAGELDDELFAHAAALDRPFFIVLRNIHADGGKRFRRLSEDPRLTGKFMTESAAVFRVVFDPRQ